MLLLNGDCIEEMQKLIDDGVQVDSVVTDPPYHLTSIVKRFGKEDSAPAQFGTDGAYARASTGFMGKEWDGGDIAFRPETWELALKLLKPGGHLLAFSASRNGDKVGLLLFAEEVEQYLPPAKGQKHVLRILREILFFPNKTKGTNLNEGLRFINQVMRRRAVVFFVSDFTMPESEKTEDENMEDLFYKEISSTKRRHDLICAQIEDPHEVSLPRSGLTTFEDAESGEVITVDLSDKKFQKEYTNEIQSKQNDFNGKLKRRGIDTFKFSTTVDFDKFLKEFFHLRKSRRI